MAEKDVNSGAMGNRRSWAAAILQVSVAVQAVGLWRWLASLGETPLLEWLHSPRDVGGWQVAEGTALTAQAAIGWFALAAGALCLWRPHWVPAAFLAVLQLAIAWAMTATDSGYPVQSAWFSPAWLRSFPLLTHAARVAAPAGLAWLAWRQPDPAPQFTTASDESSDASANRRFSWGLRVASSSPALRRCELFLRWAVAVTFAAHGIESLQANPVFVDLLLDFSSRWLASDLPEPIAIGLLKAIGVMDLVVAALCVLTRWRAVLGWMAVWGLVTAVSRVAANGPFWWHDAAVRAPHFALPLAIAWLADRVELTAADQTPRTSRA